MSAFAYTAFVADPAWFITLAGSLLTILAPLKTRSWHSILASNAAEETTSARPEVARAAQADAHLEVQHSLTAAAAAAESLQTASASMRAGAAAAASDATTYKQLVPSDALPFLWFLAFVTLFMLTVCLPNAYAALLLSTVLLGAAVFAHMAVMAVVDGCRYYWAAPQQLWQPALRLTALRQASDGAPGVAAAHAQLLVQLNRDTSLRGPW